MTALDVLWVGLGGGLGSLLRRRVGRAVLERLRSLRNVLASDSAMHLMVYATYGRAGRRALT